MAGIENLKNRIIKDDEDKARQVNEEAVSKAQEILRLSKEKAKMIQSDARVKAEKDGDDSRERIIARSHLDARNNILAAKQETIDRVLKLVQEKVDNMLTEEYTSFIEKLLLNSIETGEEEIIFSEGDIDRISPDLIEKLNSRLTLKGKKGMLKISTEKRNIKSGFILRHGGVEINCSIDSQIKILRDSLEGELASLLF